MVSVCLENRLKLSEIVRRESSPALNEDKSKMKEREREKEKVKGHTCKFQMHFFWKVVISTIMRRDVCDLIWASILMIFTVLDKWFDMLVAQISEIKNRFE